MAQPLHTGSTDMHFPEGSTWNPVTNQWEPPQEPHAIWGLAEPAHGDEQLAWPIIDDPGQPVTGTALDTRENLLTDVRRAVGPITPPTVTEIHHYQHAIDQAATAVRARTVAVVGNQTPTVLLSPNVDRARALIKIVNATATIGINAVNDGGNVQTPTASPPTMPTAQWYQSTADGTMEIKSGAGVEAYGVTATPTNVILVSVWEEVNVPGSVTGLGV